MPDKFDYSKLTDAQLEALAGGQSAAPAASGPTFDYSKLSDEDLAKIAPPAAPQAQQAGIGGAPGSGAARPEIAPRGFGEAAGRALLKGATLGWLDEGAAAISALTGINPGPGVDMSGLSIGDAYTKAQQYLEAKQRGGESAYPIASRGLEVAGGILPAILATVASGGAGAPAAASQMTNAARIALLARSGAATGALAGAGNSEPGFGNRVGGAAGGALLGAALTPAADTLTRAAAAPVASMSSAFRRGAGYALSRVAGGIQRDVAPAGGARAFSEAGLAARDAGLVRPWDFLPGADLRQAARIGAFGDAATQSITQAIDASGAKIPAAQLQQALQQASSELRLFPAANSAALSRVDGLIKDVGDNADSAGNVSARVLQSAKNTLNDLVKTWDPDKRSSLAQGLAKESYRAIAGAQENAVEAAAGPAGRAQYETAKKLSKLAINLERFQASSEARKANQLSSVGGLSGTMSLLTGIQQAAASGDPITGLIRGTLGYGATRLATSPRVAALAGLGAARVARLAPDYARSSLNPLVSNSIAQQIIANLDAPKGARR